MKRSVFIVEGQSEQLFIVKFIQSMVALQPCHVELQKFHGRVTVAISARGVPLTDATHHILIVNVENDEKVLSFIEDNLNDYKAKGFGAIYGLRDRYTGDTKK